MNLEVGQGIKYKTFDGKGKAFSHYGLIIDVSDDAITFYSVLRSFRPLGLNGEYKMPCYKDKDAVYEKHKDNVRLEDCSSVFRKLSGCRKDGVYVHADALNPIIYGMTDCALHGVTVIDGGQKVPEHVMQKVMYHPWPVQNQREKTIGEQSSSERIYSDGSRRLPGVADNMDAPQDERQCE